MGLDQFANSLHQIVSNPQVPTVRGVARHLGWQVRKAFDLFPFEQRISSSRIVAGHRACSVSALIYSQGLYDYNNMRFIQWLLRDGGVFFDIGANIGSYALVASEQPRANVFAFEPHPETFRYLSENLALNRRENVRAVNLALGTDNGTAQLTDQPGSSVNHVVAIGGPGSIGVACRRVDWCCQEWGVQPRIVKLDVEGHEYTVLQGFGDYLRHVQALLIEMNGLSEQRGVDREDIHALLASAGLIGPWWCDFDRHLLRQSVRGMREDALYLSAQFKRNIFAAGWSVEGRI